MIIITWHKVIRTDTSIFRFQSFRSILTSRARYLFQRGLWYSVPGHKLFLVVYNKFYPHVQLYCYIRLLYTACITHADSLTPNMADSTVKRCAASQQLLPCKHSSYQVSGHWELEKRVLTHVRLIRT